VCVEEIEEGCPVRIDAMRLAWLSPTNALRPVAISYTSVPNAKTSVRASDAFPSSCSGAMYSMVPISAPSAVSFRCSNEAVDEGAVADASTGPWARPKSSNIAPDEVSITLLGFTSRCTM
jgi:hypothetical protein